MRWASRSRCLVWSSPPGGQASCASSGWRFKAIMLPVAQGAVSKAASRVAYGLPHVQDEGTACTCGQLCHLLPQGSGWPLVKTHQASKQSNTTVAPPFQIASSLARGPFLQYSPTSSRSLLTLAVLVSRPCNLKWGILILKLLRVVLIIRVPYAFFVTCRTQHKPRWMGFSAEVVRRGNLEIANIFWMP